MSNCIKRGLGSYKMKKKAISMPFNWIFAIIAGAIILFIALYAANNLLKTGSSIIGVTTTKQFVSYFDPFETGLTSGKSEPITLQKKSRLYFENCNHYNNVFGRQSIGFQEQTVGGRWGENSSRTYLYDRYIFAENIVEGKKLIIFSVPIKIPFRIADVIVISSENYCFYQAPNKVKTDLRGLNLHLYNINFSESLKGCSGKIVCFDCDNLECRKKCDIKVSGQDDYKKGIVIKNNKNIHFYDDLLYGAIFSSPEIYECNLKRLMTRLQELGKVYIDKITVIKREDCNSILGSEIITLMNSAKQLQTSADLQSLIITAEKIDEINSRTSSACRLYRRS